MMLATKLRSALRMRKSGVMFSVVSVCLSVCLSVSQSASNIEKRYKRTNSAGIRLLTRCEAKETHFAYL